MYRSSYSRHRSRTVTHCKPQCTTRPLCLQWPHQHGTLELFQQLNKDTSKKAGRNRPAGARDAQIPTNPLHVPDKPARHTRAVGTTKVTAQHTHTHTHNTARPCPLRPHHEGHRDLPPPHLRTLPCPQATQVPDQHSPITYGTAIPGGEQLNLAHAALHPSFDTHRRDGGEHHPRHENASLSIPRPITQGGSEEADGNARPAAAPSAACGW